MVDPNQLIRTQVNEIASGVWYVPALLSNLYFVGDVKGAWAMVDAGTPGTAWRIRRAAEEIFGSRPPEAIILTHGHFDHTGSVKELADAWDVPVLAHTLEFPYLDGRANYPPPDPTVGGFMSQLSRMFPTSGVDIGRRLHTLSVASIPFLPGWRVIDTPGHTPGHVSIFRESDRTLITGDAVVTIDQQHAWKLISQAREIHGPPVYFTPDWDQARDSVSRLAKLRPQVLATGHGLPLAGDDVADMLAAFAERFRGPSSGRYVGAPALADEHGVYYLPPAPKDPVPMYAAGVALAAAGLLFLSARRDSQRSEADDSSREALVRKRY